MPLSQLYRTGFHRVRQAVLTSRVAVRPRQAAGVLLVALPVALAGSVLRPELLTLLGVLGVLTATMAWELPAIRADLRQGLGIGARAALVAAGPVYAFWLAFPLPVACFLGAPCALAWLAVRARLVRVAGDRSEPLPGMGAHRDAGQADPDPFAGLPPRDREILTAWRAGRSGSQIAREFQLTSKTVYNLLTRYRRQLGPDMVPKRSP